MNKKINEEEAKFSVGDVVMWFPRRYPGENVAPYVGKVLKVLRRGIDKNMPKCGSDILYAMGCASADISDPALPESGLYVDLHFYAEDHGDCDFKLLWRAVEGARH